MTAPNVFADAAARRSAPAAQAPAAQAPAAQAPAAQAPAAQAPAGAADKLFGDVNTGGGDFIPFASLIGRAVLIRPLEMGEMDTVHSKKRGAPQEFALVDLMPLTQPHADYVHPRTGAVTPMAEQPPAGEWVADMRIMQQEPRRDCAAALRKHTPFIKGWVVKGEAKGENNAPYLLMPIEDDEVNEYAKAKAIEATTGL